jgi:hypothetical protein
MERKYTPKQRRQIVEALKACKQYLWDGERDVGDKAYCICFALRRTFLHGAYLAVDVIDARIGEGNSLGRWLRYRGIPWKELTDDNMQAYRHAWVDQLIEEFSQ